jgi:hypothetical protein
LSPIVGLFFFFFSINELKPVREYCFGKSCVKDFKNSSLAGKDLDAYRVPNTWLSSLYKDCPILPLYASVFLFVYKKTLR